MEKLLDKLYDFSVSAGWKLIAAAVILIVGLKLTGMLQKLMRKGKGYERLDKTLKTFLDSFVSISLKVVVIATAAVVLGIPMTSFITVLASAGVAIGLALQGALGNFVGGLMLLFFKPFSVGDYIETASGSGTVHDITVFYTKLITPDNKMVTLPNGSLTNDAVTNFSHEPTRRQDIVYSASYNDDTELVKKTLIGLAEANESVLKDPAPCVLIKEYSASSIDYTLRVWTATEDYWKVNAALMESAKKAFDDAGISIPFPQVDVHFDKGAIEK